MFRLCCIGLVICLVLGGCAGESNPDTPALIDVVTPDLPEVSPTETSPPTPDAAEEKQAQPDEPLIFTTTMRIHEDMPEFTFHRIVGDFVPDSWYELYEIPHPNARDITIIIEDEEGNIIQSISGLTESNYGIDGGGMEFADYNFDGYLDMRLMRWSCGGESLRQIDYIWLWDTEEFQFVLNKPLMDIDAAGITANQDTRQIETWIKHANGAEASFYEYLNGELTLIVSERTMVKYDENGQPLHWETTRTNVITGEITVEINPI